MLRPGVYAGLGTLTKPSELLLAAGLKPLPEDIAEGAVVES